MGCNWPFLLFYLLSLSTANGWALTYFLLRHLFWSSFPYWSFLGVLLGHRFGAEKTCGQLHVLTSKLHLICCHLAPAFSLDRGQRESQIGTVGNNIKCAGMQQLVLPNFGDARLRKSSVWWQLAQISWTCSLLVFRKGREGRLPPNLAFAFCSSSELIVNSLWSSSEKVHDANSPLPSPTTRSGHPHFLSFSLTTPY